MVAAAILTRVHATPNPATDSFLPWLAAGAFFSNQRKHPMATPFTIRIAFGRS